MTPQTQLEAALNGTVTPEMRRVAADEGLDAELLRRRVAAGRVVIPKNHARPTEIVRGIGEGLRVKINANLGTSKDLPEPEPELEKLATALEYGADAVMDLSTGGDLRRTRRLIIERSTVPVGTVPIYDAAVRAAGEKRKLIHLTPDELFEVIEEHGEDGVDFITVHCGVSRRAVELLQDSPRVAGVVSRGGAILTEWIVRNGAENPLLEQYDRLLEIARRYDMTLSLGDGLRPGCLADATDRPQIEELVTLGELARRAREAGVQVMIEGPGHVPLDQVATNVKVQKALCDGAPFYVLGPLVTDIAPGYDHIVGAIGGAVAALAGADFLCYVTPAEHICLPDTEHVKHGVIASRIAAHAADVARGLPGARERDDAMGRARCELDWEKQHELALDPETLADWRERRRPTDDRVCTMCSELCAIKGMRRALYGDPDEDDPGGEAQ
ncbi:MAG: phosphomethylpyrimidine synthase ThiC [Candidatus Coatesbacteria bacterium]|nr:phosphomethylpyrimidine synthase ThiC [Candidatus Coatesbacteria bacterium]